MDYLIIILVLGISLAITPFAIRLHIIDMPNERKIHNKPIPKAGGLGIFIPFLTGMVWFILNKNQNKSDIHLLSAVAALLVIIGLIDDKFELKARYKLLLQVLLSCISMAFGLMFKNLGWFNIPVTFLWYIGMINGVNLIDGLDGLAGGIGFISSLAFGIMGILLNHPEIFIVSISLALGCLGFLAYNFHPAKIFMGDTGSLPLGYTLAGIGIMISNASGNTIDLLLPGVILCIPIYDTLLAIVRRKLNGMPWFEPDRSHFYNLLMDIHGIGHCNTTLLICVFNLITAVIGLIFLKAGIVLKIVLVLCLVIGAVILTIKLKFITIDKKSLELSSERISIFK